MNIMQEDREPRAAIGTSADRLFKDFFLNIMGKISPDLQCGLAEKLHGERSIERLRHHRFLSSRKDAA